jgi:anti-sigma factor RsiW
MTATATVRRLLGLPPSRECAHVGGVLQRYLDEEIDQETARRVAAHLEVCRHCGLEAATYRRLKAALARRAIPDDETMSRLRLFVDELAAGDIRDEPQEP